jgi:trans-2,3-dihydro-3-hydroxyanthranilate isomerase
MIFEETAGLVRLSLTRDGALVVGARLVPPQSLSRGGDIDTEILAAASSLTPDDIETATHRPCIASCGIPFAFAELKTRAALAAARPRADVFTTHLPAERITGVLLYVHDRRGGFDLQVRMFGPLVGIAEDAASGSANVALAGLLASLRPEPDLKLAFRIAQGIDMGRPSVLEAGAEKRGGKVIGMTLGGRCVPMMRGVLEV